MDLATIEAIFKRFAEVNPTPKSELYYTNLFTLIIAVLLSAQSTDREVNKVTKILFKIADNPAHILSLGIINLKNYIKSIGLYNNKAKNIIAISEKLVEQQDIKDINFNQLISLPGIGRKSANVILNIAFNSSHIGVDTHVQRVSNRIGLVNTTNVNSTEQILNNIIPEHWKKYVNHWLVLHGRYICTAKKPKCFNCFIVDLCEYKYKNLLKNVS